MALMRTLQQDPQWHYPLDTLKTLSPSSKDGISFDEELTRFCRGVRFIADVSEQLKLPIVTIYTAITYLSRFYLRYSHAKVHAFDAASACIFLASKTEETARRIKEVAAACTRVALKQPKMQIDDNSKDFNKWIGTITYHEELLLEALYFDLAIKSPYTILKSQLETIGLQNLPALQSAAQQYMQDCCKTLVLNVYTADLLAGASILWGSKELGMEISDVGENPWWEALGFERSKLVEVVNTTVNMLNVVRKGTPPLESIT